MKTYFTKHNGAEPYKVEITDNHVVVYNCREDDYEDEYKFQTLTYNAIRVFIGGHGDRYDGNSILIEIENNTYVYIGHMIDSFTTKARIVSYLSPMGNSCVPYPYAIDEFNNYYLMIEDVILLNTHALQKYIADGGDPFDYYYSKHWIVTDRSNILNNTQINPTGFMDIRYYYIDEEDSELEPLENGFEQNDDRLQSYNLSYQPNTIKEHEWYFPKHRKKNHYIVIGNNPNLIPLSEKMYFEIMDAFGRMMGFSTIHKNIID